MKKLFLLLALLTGIAAGQTTTSITGTIKDLTNAVVTSGKVTFTLTPSRDTTISGLARFSPQTVTCVINGSGLIKALDGVSTCTITMNTALQPPGSYYVVGIWPYNVKTSTFTFYAVLSSYDWSTVVPTPTTSPAQNFVDIFSNQTIGGNKIWSGTHTFNGAASFPGGITGNVGPLSVSSLNAAMVIVDATTAGADASCKIATGIGLLPANGGAIYAYDLNDIGGTGACSLDPGLGKTVHLYLGPYIYHISQLTMRSNMHVIGVGSSNCTEPCNATVIQATTAGTNPIVIPTSPPVIGAVFQGFSLVGTAGNSSQDGMHFVPSTNGGIWYSEWMDITVTGFKGVGILFDGQAGGSPNAINQFNSLRDVYVQRVAGGAPALKIIGLNGQFSFDRCQFDGTAKSDSADVIIAQGTPAPTLPPYTINFNNVTMQKADHALDISGDNTFLCHNCHFETLNGVLLVSTGANFGTYSITMDGSYINGDVGINSGSGYVVNITQSSPTGSTVKFDGNYLLSVPAGPDHLCTGHCENVSGFGNVVGNNLPYNVIGGGLDPNGGGFKHQRVAGCATAASLNATCDTTITWPTAFSSANYTVTCTGERVTSGVPIIEGQAVSAAKTAAAVTVRTLAVTAAAAQFTTIDCNAVQDVTTNF